MNILALRRMLLPLIPYLAWTVASSIGTTCRKACTLSAFIPNLLNAMGHLTAKERLCRCACCMTRRVLPAVWKRELAKLGYTNETIEVVDQAGAKRLCPGPDQTFSDACCQNRYRLHLRAYRLRQINGAGALHGSVDRRTSGGQLPVHRRPPGEADPGMYQIPVNSKEGDERGDAYTNAIAGTNRDDTDTVMIGEIRYAEAALATIEVALSGNAVWATIHAADALGIIQRLDVQLRSRVADPLNIVCDPIVLSGLVFQRLVPQALPVLQDAPEGSPGRHCSRSAGQVA